MNGLNIPPPSIPEESAPLYFPTCHPQAHLTPPSYTTLSDYFLLNELVGPSTILISLIQDLIHLICHCEHCTS